MKVGRSSGTTGAGGPSGARAPAGGSAFNLPAAGAAGSAAPAARAAGVTGVASLDALLALQQADGPLERRRKAVGRAGRILDVLDDLKLAVIDGEVSGAHLERLMRAVRDQRENTENPGLEGVLDEIEMRASVELAKLQRAKIAA
ncbi:MAG: flagellar assembly protein FliX [Caulobacteraceae bacterium]|nr:MAG: flagellar assembly protein FliX [Caulobacteraceae bacterium]